MLDLLCRVVVRSALLLVFECELVGVGVALLIA